MNRNDIDTLKQNMRDLRSGKYNKLIGEIRKILGIEDTVDNASMEALFIMVTEDCFLDNLYKAKSVLVALGLVKDTAGMEHMHWLVRKNSVGMRRKQFFDEIGETEISLETQRQNDGRWINEVADYLCGLDKKEEGIEGYLKKAEARYKSSVADYIPDDELPALSDIGKRPVVQDGLIGESLSVDAEQGANDNLINPYDKVDEYELKPFTGNEPTPISLPLPNRPKDTEGASRKRRKIFPDQTQEIKRLQRRQNIVTAMVIVLVVGATVYCLHSYLSNRMAENQNEAAPMITDILVITPEIQLYPGNEALIQLDIAPSEADIDSVSCIPCDSGVATVAHRVVTAQPEWQEENHETKIEVQGGTSPRSYVHVTVLPDPGERFTGADRPDGRLGGNEGKGGGQ